MIIADIELLKVKILELCSSCEEDCEECKVKKIASMIDELPQTYIPWSSENFS